MRYVYLFSTAVISAAVIAGVARGGVAVAGKKTSVASSSVSQPIPAYPATVTVLSVAVPATYKSKKNLLTINTSVQESCNAGDNIGSVLFVGGVAAEPDPTSNYYFDNQGANPGYQNWSRQWFLIPETAGGPAIAPGSLIELKATSAVGTCSTLSAALQATLSK